MDNRQSETEYPNVRHIFIIGSKSIGQYGGYETFVDRLLKEHRQLKTVKYHVACKANGEGCMDESKLEEIEVIKRDKQGRVIEFEYNNAHVFKIACPSIGAAVALYYDKKAFEYCIEYCRENNIKRPVFYVLTCRIGFAIKSFKEKVRKLGGTYYLNPDGHEWKRAKWNRLIKSYWKWSEKKMVKAADMVVCDSLLIEKYIKKKYGHSSTTFIPYGADIAGEDYKNEAMLDKWLGEKKSGRSQYYLAVGRNVPENNYETIIREFMLSKSRRKLIIITDVNGKNLSRMEQRLKFSGDDRICFVGTVYDSDLLSDIRKSAYGYFHGHEVGGTNPSLLESLGSTELNLLYDVGFNREVASDAALYWNKTPGNLTGLIDRIDSMDESIRRSYGDKAKKRITGKYSWKHIGDEYVRLWDL